MVDKQPGYDPRKAEFNGVAIEDWEPSQWKQWKPKHTGTDYCANVEREYLRMKYAIQRVNSQLDISRERVNLKLTSPKAIGLQGSFPCKPGEVGKNGSPNKQYTISLGIPANDAGVNKAEHEARAIAYQLTHGTFKWTPELLGKQAQKLAVPKEEKPEKLINEWVEDYEVEYWKTHEKTRQGLKNWNSHYLGQLRKLSQDVVLSNDALTKALESTLPNTEARFRLSWQLKKFCAFCGFDGITVIKSFDTGVPLRKRRFIPDDKSILNRFKKIGSPLPPCVNKNVNQPEQWQWVYGMIAAYGLRPHELFAVDLKAYTDPSNTYHLVVLNPELTDGTKTGERNCSIPPLHPDWVELFDLKKVKPITCEADFRSRTKAISRKFLTSDIGFTPYDLRHAYAIRGHRLRIPVRTMADYMGHTVKEHTNTYQKWMNKDINLEIYKEVVLEEQTTTQGDLRAEVTRLRAEVETLKAENESLRALLVRYQLGASLNPS